MSMTKKDYVAIAMTLNEAKPTTVIGLAVWTDIVRRMTSYCELQSALDATTSRPLFDRARFLKACGVQSS